MGEQEGKGEAAGDKRAQEQKEAREEEEKAKEQEKEEAEQEESQQRPQQQQSQLIPASEDQSTPQGWPLAPPAVEVAAGDAACLLPGSHQLVLAPVPPGLPCCPPSTTASPQLRNWPH
ncbi:TATA-box-binding protein-like [Fukomys damarensis]|uniref:TATA-box-binding protein-like n=1 Tax=Fukomys damarensis TaxID=885580 RepID=UPI0008FEB356|nr:TATA-box-binding protein-like [Fukomys damarensis]